MEYNCTQFTEPYLHPSTDEAMNSTIPWLITTVVQAYRPYHYYLLTFIVVFSFVVNILIVKVLSHKEMRYSGVNVTMLVISVCDFACAVTGLAQLYLRNYSDGYSSYLTAYSQITVDYLSVAFHASSLYLAVGMAFCKVMSLKGSNKNRGQWQSPLYAFRMVLAICTPVFIMGTIVIFVNEVKQTEKDGIYMETSDLSIAHGCLYMKITILANGICFKMIPCLSMLCLSFIILKRMDEAKKSAVHTRSVKE